MHEINYQQLFEFLDSLGFEECSVSPVEKVFEHGATETMVAFSLVDESGEMSIVSNPDYLSVEVRLDQCGLIDSPLRDAIRVFQEAR